MILRLEESQKAAFGFKVTGKLTADDVGMISAQMEHFIAQHKRPIGLLADLSEMEGASWAARWEEMRFLQRHSDHIARMAVISADEWRDVSKVALVATAMLPRRFTSSPPRSFMHGTGSRWPGQTNRCRLESCITVKACFTITLPNTWAFSEFKANKATRGCAKCLEPGPTP